MGEGDKGGKSHSQTCTECDRTRPPDTHLQLSRHTTNTPSHMHHTHARVHHTTHTATTTTYSTFSDVMLGQPCATDSIDLSVKFLHLLRGVRA